MMYSFNCQFSIFNFSVSQILRFSDFHIFRFGRSGKPSGFPLYLCSLFPLPIPARVPAPALNSRPRIPSPSPNPEKLAKDAAPIPNAAGE